MLHLNESARNFEVVGCARALGYMISTARGLCSAASRSTTDDRRELTTEGGMHRAIGQLRQ